MQNPSAPLFFTEAKHSAELRTADNSLHLDICRTRTPALIRHAADSPMRLSCMWLKNEEFAETEAWLESVFCV